VRRRLVVTVLLLGAGEACRTPRQEKAAPVIDVVEERAGADGPCAKGRVTIVHGPVPEGAREVVRLHATASAPVPLAEMERVLAGRASRHCALGLSVLQARAADGSLDVDDVNAVAFEPLPAR
jgi:hypothetical protein